MPDKLFDHRQHQPTCTACLIHGGACNCSGPRDTAPAGALPWTQTEWKYEPINGYQYVVVIDQQAQILLVAAAVPPGREAEVKANMRLAAHAPKLYAIVEALLRCVDDHETVGVCIGVKDAARRILADARGDRRPTNAQ
jgi:hypothetical protein